MSIRRQSSGYSRPSTANAETRSQIAERGASRKEATSDIPDDASQVLVQTDNVRHSTNTDDKTLSRSGSRQTSKRSPSAQIKSVSTVTSNPESEQAHPNTLTFVWLDEHIAIDEHYSNGQKRLQKILDRFEAFSDCDKCLNYLQKADHQDIILVISPKYGEKLMSIIQNINQVTECYIYWPGTVGNKEWTMKYVKVKEIITDMAGLISKLTEEAAMAKEGKKKPRGFRDAVPINIYALSTNGNISTQQQRNERNAKFMYFLLFLEITYKLFQSDESTTNDVVEYCAELYKDDKQQQNNIREFKRSYNSERAIWWYTQESFFYRSINKAIRVQDYDALYALRGSIIDLCVQLEKEHKKFLRNYSGDPILRVYRGQLMSLDEFCLIRDSIGDFLSVNTFLSTSLNDRIALKFAETNAIKPDFISILFQFKIDTRISNTAPYARINHLSDYHDENELLISPGSIFKIEEVTHYDVDGTIPYLKLSLCSRDDFALKHIMARVKQDIGDDIIGFGYLLTFQGKYGRARECFQELLNRPSLSHFDAAQCYRGLGSIELYRDEYSNALKHFKNALKLLEKYYPEDHESTGCAHRCVAEVYQWMGEDKLAFEHLEKAMSLLPEDTLEMAKVYSVLANIYKNQQLPHEALDYYQKVQAIRKNHLPDIHSDIAITYNNMGAVYFQIGDYDQAAECFSESLSIKEKTLPPDHSSICETRANIDMMQARFYADDAEDEN